MLTVPAYAATSPTDPLVLTTITRRDVGPRDVLIEAAAINDAYERVLRSDVRYRFVLDATSFSTSSHGGRRA